jgi:hypothetical protein
MTTTDIPTQIGYGQVVGRFVRFTADTPDPGNVPDEIPLEGTITLTPLTTAMRWPTAVPPRLAVADTLTCLVVDGDLYPPGGGPDAGVYVVATDQPNAVPSLVQWRANFNFAGISPQPNPVVFNVPAGGVVDLSIVAPVAPDPPTIVVVDPNSAIEIAQAVEDAEAAAAAAAASAAAAGTAVGGQYSQTLGGSAAGATVTVTHGLGTLDLMWQVVEVATGIVQDTNFTAATINTLVGSFPAVTAPGQYRVVVLARSAGGAGYLLPGDLESELAVKANSSEVVAKGELVYNIRDHAGVVGDGIADDTAAINSAAAAAAALGSRLYASGTFRINSTVNIACACDLSGATFNYYGSGVALKVGGQTSGVLLRTKTLALPAVVNMNKTVPGWAQSGVAGTVGILAQNLYESHISVPKVTQFETGLKVYGEGIGTAYTTFDLYSITNNKIGLLLDHNGTGWVNQNLFIGGNISHPSSEGSTPTAGIGHIVLTRSGTPNGGPNNNTFLNVAVESAVVQYMVDIGNGSYNQFINCRWETPTTGSVRWGALSAYNRITGGYGVDQLVEVKVAGQTRNMIDGSDTYKRVLAGAGMILENLSGSSFPILTFMKAGGSAAGTDPATGYVARLEGSLWHLKRDTDAQDRMQIDPANGRVIFGNGAVVPSVSFIANGTNGVELTGGSLYFTTDNAADIGSTASFRPRHVRAGTSVQAASFIKTGAAATASRPLASVGAGAMFFDTTLNKPIWSDGTNWKDATGATV